MKALNIKDNEEFLRQISKEVELNDKKLNSDIKILEEYCIKNEVFAMAAVQLGIPKRIIYLKNTRLDKIDDNEYNESKILINPVIISRKGLTRYWEACVSCGDLTGLVERPYEIEVEYYNEKFEKQKIILRDFAATVFSHEFDHLDGILHIDIALEVKEMTIDERKMIRKTHGYEIISKDSLYDSRTKTKKISLN